MENNKNPNIRFKGFTDPWEQRKFSDIVARESSISTSTTDIPSVEYEDVVAEEGRLNKDVHLKETVKSGITFDGSQVLYGKLRPYLHNWLNPDFKGIAVGDWWVLKPINIDKKFLYRLIQTQQFDNIANQSSGSKMPRADWNLISNSEFTVPFSKEEQSKIGRYFDSLDNLITLHQRKYNKLLNVKKSMLEKMFPKNGSNIPEIRFKGFTDPWEQRKAKSLFVSTADKGHPELPVLSATQDRGMIRRDENSINIYHDKKNEEGYKRVLPGQFVIHLRSFQGGFAHSAIEGITSPAYTVFGFSEPEKHNPNYWKYVFTSKEFIRRLETVTYGIRDGRSISYDEFLTMDFVYPMQDEQTKIANYLDTLDNLITLHQRELEKLQNIKKSMLEKMFV